MPSLRSKRPKDTVSSVRVGVPVLKKAGRAARKLRITRNAFIVRAMEEKADAVLAPAEPLARAS